MIFKRKTQGPTTPPPAPPDNGFTRYLGRRAAGVQGWMDRQGPGKRKWLFIVSALVFGTYCGMLLFNKDVVQPHWGITPMTIPKVVAPVSPQGSSTYRADQERLRHLVDSLQKDVHGRRVLDSLQHALGINRPQ